MWYEIGALAFCLFYTYNAVQLRLGSLAEPGPGLFPVALGVLGAFVAAILLFASLRGRRAAASGGESAGPGGSDWSQHLPLVLYIGAIAALALLLETMGTLIGLAALAIILAKLCGLGGWKKPLALGAVTSTAAYCVFALIFRIPMPAGILSGLL